MPTRTRILPGATLAAALVLAVGHPALCPAHASNMLGSPAVAAAAFVQQHDLPQRPPATNPPVQPTAMPRIEGQLSRMPGDTGQPLNVKVDVTIADQGGTTPGFKKTMSVTVADRARSSIRSRIDLPVPTTTFTPAASAQDREKPASINPMVSYNYRSLGLNLDVSEIAIDGNFVRLRLTIEYSPLDEKPVEGDARVAAPPGMPPAIANFQQTLSLILEDGKPLTVAQTSDPIPSRDRRQTVEVKATILR
jgi:hypothetical protein